MDIKDIDYVALLTCVRKVKQRIDELVDRNLNEISNQEIKCTRKEFDKMCKKYFFHVELNESQNNNSKSNQKSEINSGKVTKPKTTEHYNGSLGFGTQIMNDKLNTCAKPKINDHKECRIVTIGEDNSKKEDNTNDSHKNCRKKMKLYETYIKELESRLKEVTDCMNRSQEKRTDQKNISKDNNLETTISKLKKNENCYKAEIRRLTKKLECERKLSENYQKRVDEAFNKLKKLSETAEKVSTDSEILAKSLSLIVADLLRSSTASDELDNGSPCAPNEKKHTDQETTYHRPEMMAEMQKVCAESSRTEPKTVPTRPTQDRQHCADRKTRRQCSSWNDRRPDNNNYVGNNNSTFLNDTNGDDNCWTGNAGEQQRRTQNNCRESGGKDDEQIDEEVMYMLEGELVTTDSYETITESSGECTCYSYNQTTEYDDDI